MRRIIIFIILLAEAFGVFSFSFVIAKKEADHCGSVIQVPEGMRLTFDQDVSITTDEGDIMFSAGTIIIPEMIQRNEVYFFYEDVGVILNVGCESFTELDELNALREKAEKKKIDDQRLYIMRGVVLGCICGVGWVIIGYFINIWLIKKNRKKVLITINAIAVVLILLLIKVLLYNVH